MTVCWAQRRRGELGPVVEGETRERLLRLVEAGRPERLVLVGDIVHAPRPAAEERAMIAQTLTALRDRTELVCVLGNHDRAFSTEFPEFPAVAEWRTSGVRVVHGMRGVRGVCAAGGVGGARDGSGGELAVRQKGARK